MGDSRVWRTGSLRGARGKTTGALSRHTFADNTYAARPAISGGGAHGTGVRKTCQQLTRFTRLTATSRGVTSIAPGRGGPSGKGAAQAPAREAFTQRPTAIDVPVTAFGKA